MTADDLQAKLRSAKIEATVCDIQDGIATVSSQSYIDWVFARSLIERQGLRAIRPGALSGVQ
jgi:hypothetical protein